LCVALIAGTKTTECDRCGRARFLAKTGPKMHRDPHHLNVRFSFQGPSGIQPSVLGAKNLEDLHPSVNRKSAFSSVFQRFRIGRVRVELAAHRWGPSPSFVTHFCGNGGGGDESGLTFPTGFPRAGRALGVIKKRDHPSFFSIDMTGINSKKVGSLEQSRRRVRLDGKSALDQPVVRVAFPRSGKAVDIFGSGLSDSNAPE